VHLLPLASSKVSLPVMIVSAGSLIANAFVVYKVCGAISPRSPHAPIIAAGITAFYFPLVFWSLRGMEVGILSLLVDLGVLFALQLVRVGRLQSSVFLALIFIAALAVRLDSILQLSAILVYVFARPRARLRLASIPLAALLLTAVGILWLQRAYFGDVLPNTFYQKVVGAAVSERMKFGVLAFTQYATRDTLTLALLSIAGILLYKDLRSREIAALVALFLVQCLFSVWVGGDYAEPEVDAANRFITQGMPLLFVVFGLAADRMIADLTRRPRSDTMPGPRFHAGIAIGLAFAVVIVISGKPWITWAIDNAPLLKADIRRVKVGLSIAQYSSPEATIAVHAAGQIPYYSDRRTIDLLGLNDPVIAKGPLTGPFYPGHDKWNYDYSIQTLKPDLVADNWIRLGDYMRNNPDYAQLENGMYVRKDSTLLDVSGLSQATGP
jgi:arabinofuranosyltransferase